MRTSPRASVPSAKLQRHAVGVLGKANDALAEADRVRIERARFIGENGVEIGAMHLRVRRAVQPLVLRRQREALNFLAGVVQAKDVSARMHADLADRRLEAEMTQGVHGVGADLDTGPDLLQPRRLLVNLDLVSVLDQERGRGEPAEPRTRDQDLALLLCRHSPTPYAA